jgi:uncharacterized protein YjbI with pentapeptide repeats
MNVRSRPHPVIAAVAGLVVLFLALGCALAQSDAGSQATGHRYTIWDLRLNTHASQLRRDVYFGFACGTDGGPPSTQLKSWTDFAQCPPDPETGLHEVYFRYDEELHYRGLAHDPLGETGTNFEGTSEFQQPVIVSGLFNDNGFLVGLRMVTDPRTTTAIRELGVNLADVLQSRYGFDGWGCTDLPRDEGDTPYKGALIKTRCTKDLPDQGFKLVLDRHYYRRKGQLAVDPATHRPTEGQFVSLTRFERLLDHPIANERLRLAALPKPKPTPIDQLAAKAQDCPGCNFAGANLKWADLHGANLAGADLSGAVLLAADLSGANLSGANLEGADLNRANLRQADLSGANLSKTMMYEARLDGADLTGADMSGALAAKLQSSSVLAEGLTAIRSDFRMARMPNARFAKADFSGSWFNDAQMSRADLAGAHLVESRLWAANLTYADLTGADVHGADLTSADLRSADLSSADFSAANLHLAKTADVKTENTNFQDAQLPASLR